jgi:glutaredoxin
MSTRVVLYTRDGCHLCEEARTVVEKVCADAGAEWSEVDIDRDALLRGQYSDEVPVVTVDSQVVGFWRIDPQVLRDALR